MKVIISSSNKDDGNMKIKSLRDDFMSQYSPSTLQLVNIYHDEWDFRISDEPDYFVGTYHADCTTIFFMDDEAEVVAIAHCGWKPMIKGVIEKCLESMVTYHGCSLKKMHVHIGVGLCPECFYLGEDVIKLIPKKFIDNKGRYNINEHIKSKLIYSGIFPYNISESKSCTIEDNYYSKRGDNQAPPLEVNLAVIGFKK